MTSETISLIETAIRRDPGRRGLLGESGGPLGLGELADAARSLSQSSGHVVIVTGFYIPLAEPAAAETDGPPGAVALAYVLQKLGRKVSLVTDHFCGTTLVAAAQAMGLTERQVYALTHANELQELLREQSPVSHLIAIERVGPGYADCHIRSRYGCEAESAFTSIVPEELWSRCLNMRGVPIEDWTVDFSPLFENPPAGITTVGIGDGGNELGLGKLPWNDLVSRLTGVADPRILCRVATDFAVIGGTSNWAAYGLAAATACLMEQPEAFAEITPASQQQVLERMVVDGPAVDGVTRQFEATVDGLPLTTYLEPLCAIRRRLGYVDEIRSTAVPRLILIGESENLKENPPFQSS